MKKPELLAPAGNMESLIYAVQAGCDAVYIGGKKYGARAFSNNFSDDEIIEAIKYCHLYVVKLYVTLNTLIHDQEVNEFLNFVDFLHRNNIDAVLIQDIGMFDLLHKTYPNLELHISTQMHVHNLDGVLLMEKLGAKRVVLARETPIEKIKNIKNNSNVEIEVFVHGSLCMSYSGQCLLGYYFDNRSGNRGECSGVCRQTFDITDDNNKTINSEKYPLSTKDLCSLNNIDQLIDIGVDSLKIEGRMKSPEYVYMVVSLYRQAIDSYCETGKVIINEQKLSDLKKIYNRTYTKGFLMQELNNNFVNMSRPNHQGVVIGKVINYKKPYVTIKLNDDISIGSGLRVISKDNDVGILLNEFYINRDLVKKANNGDVISLKIHSDVNIGDEVLVTKDNELINKIKVIVDNKPRKIAIDVEVMAKSNETLYIKFNDNNNIVSVFGSLIKPSINISTTEEDIFGKLNKLGDTVYYIDKFNIEIDNGIHINLSELNELRRKLVNELNEKRLYKSEYQKHKYFMDNLLDYKPSALKTVLVENKEQYLKVKDKFDIVYSEERLNNTIQKLPRVIDEYPKDNKQYLISELGGINAIENFETDCSLNVYNAYSVALLHSLGANKITLSRELSYEDIKYLIENYHRLYDKHPNLEVIIKGKLELMISKFNLCEYFNYQKLFLLDHKGLKNIIKIKDNNMIIYSAKELMDIHNYYVLGINSLRENIVD